MNPVSSADVAMIVSDRVEAEIKKAWTGKSKFYEPATLAPAGVLFIAPGDNVEFGEKVVKGLKSQWKWVTFNNALNVIGEGKEKKWENAISEATASIMTWALPFVAVDHDRMQKAGKTDEQVKKALAKFNIREFTPDGSKLPKAGNTKKIKGPSGMTAKITAEKSKKSQKRAGDTVWYVEVFDDDGKPVGAAEGQKKVRMGPMLDGVAAYAVMNSIWGVIEGEEDYIEANPVQRRRLNSTARRKVARKNKGEPSFWDHLKDTVRSPGVKAKTGIVGAEELSEGAFDLGTIIPNDSYAAHQLGYYQGILRGMNTCKWYPDPVGAVNRWWFKRELNKRYIDAVNRLAENVADYEPQVRSIRTGFR